MRKQRFDQPLRVSLFEALTIPGKVELIARDIDKDAAMEAVEAAVRDREEREAWRLHRRIR